MFINNNKEKHLNELWQNIDNTGNVSNREKHFIIEIILEEK